MSVKELSPLEVQQQLQDDPNAVLLDCREDNEYQLVHIQNCRLLPMSQLVERVGEIQDYADRPVIVYCHHGMRSLRVANWLAGNGFTDVASMSGGIDLWALEIDPDLPRY